MGILGPEGTHSEAAAVWLNPLHKRLWDYDHSTWTIVQIRKIFPMYQLSAAGLEQSIQKLKSTGP